MTDVDRAVVEITGLLAAFAPQHEGLRDFKSLNLKDVTKIEIENSLALYDRRQGLLEAALAALEALVTDGHPDIPVREISAVAFADLQDNTSTIEAAMARFASNAATSIQLVPGETVPK